MADSKVNISQAKKIRRDICRTVGHSWDNPPRCSRCKYKSPRVVLPTFDMSVKPKVKYADIVTRRFNILDRAKDRARDSDKT